MAKRNRIMYASQSVRANGHLLYRVQTLGSNSTFTSEFIYELGHLDTVDMVDDVPAVAVTLDTNDFGTPETMAVLAGLNPATMSGVPDVNGAYLRTQNIAGCSTSGVHYYHGVSLADFTLSNGVAIWAPVQNEASLGTADDSLQMTMFMDKVYVNNITLTYNVGANATENYAAETDNKMWLMNSGRFVTQEEWDFASGITNNKLLYLGLPNSATLPELSNCKRAFLAWTDEGDEGIIVKESTERDGTIYQVVTVSGGSAGQASKFVYNPAAQTLYAPSNAATLWPSGGVKVIARYGASQYGASGSNTASPGAGMDSSKYWGKYFELVSTDTAPDYPKTHYPEDVGALRQGQVEVYLVDPDTLAGKTNSDWDMQLRIQTVTITATPTRTPLNELGHIRPYARPMNFPVEITSNIATTAADLEQFAVFAGKEWADYDPDQNATGVDLTITHLMSKENTILVVKIFQQTNEEAGGNGMSRKAMLPTMALDEYYEFGTAGNYLSYDVDQSGYVGSCINPPRERPLKTIIVPSLKITAENYNNSVGGGRGGGANATQEFNFRSTNEMYVLKGDIDIQDVNCIERNSSALQY